MKDKAKKICDAIEVLLDACCEIKESGRCGENCPMHNLCFEDTSFLEVADLLHSELVAEFIKVAEG